MLTCSARPTQGILTTVICLYSQSDSAKHCTHKDIRCSNDRKRLPKDEMNLKSELQECSVYVLMAYWTYEEDTT